jgi:asparagine N-glycosylation enzyme membrane subunit Stt3
MNINQRPEDDKVISRNDWQYISVLLGIGFLTRMVFFSQIYLISNDAFQYVPMAKLFAWGEYREVLYQHQLPLYPYLIAVFSKITGNFEISGQIISIITSILAVIPLFLLGKSIFGETAAFWSGIFYFLNPEMLQRSVDVLKETLLIFLLFSAVFFFYLFLKQRRISWLVVSTLVTLL